MWDLDRSAVHLAGCVAVTLELFGNENLAPKLGSFLLHPVLGSMPTCDAASVPPTPTEAAVPLSPLPDGVQGAGAFVVLKIGAADFVPGRAPRLSKTIAYSLQNQWPPGAAKPKSENYSAALVKRFLKRLTGSRSNDGYALQRIGLIVLSEAHAATLEATDRTLITDASYTEFLSYLGTVARQLAHEYSGTVHEHAVAAWHALTAQPVEPLGVVRLYHAARLAAAGAAGGGADAGDAQDPAILGQIGEFLEVCRLRAELGPTAVIKWLNKDFEMGWPYDILVEYPNRNGDGGFEEVEVDVKVAGIKAHEDPSRPPKKPNSTRELKIEIRIPADTVALWSGGETAAGARRRVLHVVVPAMSARA